MNSCKIHIMLTGGAVSRDIKCVKIHWSQKLKTFFSYNFNEDEKQIFLAFFHVCVDYLPLAWLCFVYQASLITVEMTHAGHTAQYHCTHAKRNFIICTKTCFIHRNRVHFRSLIMTWCIIKVYSFRTSSPHGGNCVPDHNVQYCPIPLGGLL